MKLGPFLAIAFAFFLIAIFPYYAGNDEPILITSDEDGDGITDDKDKCIGEVPSEGEDLNQDGCIDSKMTNDEISYIKKISKFNLAQYLFFAIVAIVGSALYWERKKIRSVLYDDDEFVTNFKKNLDNDKETENIDYDKLGEDKVYTEQTGSIFDGFKFSFRDFNAEADKSIQIISIVCLAFLLIGPNQAWLQVEGESEELMNSDVLQETIYFDAKYFSNHWETTTGNTTQGFTVTINEYENHKCTDEIMEVYNCNSRSALFGTVDQFLTLSALLCFIVFILNFRAEKYRRSIAIFFTLSLVTTMASLLIFTSLIDNVIESDRLLYEDEEKAGTCWMDKPMIWGETECLIQIDNRIYTDTSTFTPGISFWIILTTISILFVGLFTSIEPLITMEKRTWAEALRQNWQVFAMIFAIFFLWRLNELMLNL
tara:strand:+ start:252 stop:1535 length:1284 start_codon:yes stop_codon:yes gene_type:complete